MGHLFVIRHGQTEWSAVGRHTGRTDLPLTDRGRRQGEELAKMIASRTFELVLTSPLARARVTCDLAGLGDQAVVEPDLAEWDYGEFEGLTTDEIRQRIPRWSIWTHPPEKGERLDHLASRADRVIARAGQVEGDVALFGHGHALRVLAARWLRLAPIAGTGFVLKPAPSVSLAGTAISRPLFAGTTSATCGPTRFLTDERPGGAKPCQPSASGISCRSPRCLPT